MDSAHWGRFAQAPSSAATPSQPSPAACRSGHMAPKHSLCSTRVRHRSWGPLPCCGHGSTLFSCQHTIPPAQTSKARFQRVSIIRPPHRESQRDRMQSRKTARLRSLASHARPACMLLVQALFQKKATNCRILSPCLSEYSAYRQRPPSLQTPMERSGAWLFSPAGCSAFFLPLGGFGSWRTTRPYRLDLYSSLREGHTGRITEGQPEERQWVGWWLGLERLLKVSGSWVASSGCCDENDVCCS